MQALVIAENDFGISPGMVVEIIGESFGRVRCRAGNAIVSFARREINILK